MAAFKPLELVLMDFNLVAAMQSLLSQIGHQQFYLKQKEGFTGMDKNCPS